MGRQITEHFNEDELRCRCGCGRMEFSDEAVQELEDLRRAFGQPMRISSGYRCPYHNSNVSMTGLAGPHTWHGPLDIAVDVLVHGTQAWRLVQLATEQGWKGIGVSQRGPRGARFIHLDLREQATVWSY